MNEKLEGGENINGKNLKVETTLKERNKERCERDEQIARTRQLVQVRIRLIALRRENEEKEKNRKKRGR